MPELEGCPLDSSTTTEGAVFSKTPANESFNSRRRLRGEGEGADSAAIEKAAVRRINGTISEFFMSAVNVSTLERFSSGHPEFAGNYRVP
jgi:hypothetical protein